MPTATTNPLVLVILDGFGIAQKSRGNAITAASTPTLNFIEKSFPFTVVQASGVAVGLPWGEAGNSEVGHLTIGAGRVLYHHLPRIIFSIQDGSFFKNEAFISAAEHVKKNSSALHILGLASSGSVHSYIDHLYALLEFSAREELPKVFVHVVTDGKDAPPQEGGKFLPMLEDRMKQTAPNAKIVSLVGRFYAMDRDEKWDRVKRAYELFVDGKGASFTDIGAYMAESYTKGVQDQFIEPACRVDENGAPVGRINDNDALIVFDFREDSEREMAEAFVKPGFDIFPKRTLQNFLLVTMTEYEKNLPALVAFPPLDIFWPLGRVISDAGKTQLHIAETEKYAHVTYFFNGGQEKPFPGEGRILVPSAAVPHFDEKPEMQAEEIKKRALENIAKYDFILINFANADMVGHTGNFTATVAAIEALDKALGELIAPVLDSGAACLITADHGNAEKKIDLVSGEPLTEHTTNPVPLYFVAKQFQLKKPRTDAEIERKKQDTKGILADIAPTALELMRLPQPEEMTGKSLLPALLAG